MRRLQAKLGRAEKAGLGDAGADRRECGTVLERAIIAYVYLLDLR